MFVSLRFGRYDTLFFSLSEILFSFLLSLLSIPFNRKALLKGKPTQQNQTLCRCAFILSEIFLELLPDEKEGKEITFLNVFQKSSDVFLLARRNNKILGFYKLCDPSLFFLFFCFLFFVCGMSCFPLGQESSHDFSVTVR